MSNSGASSTTDEDIGQKLLTTWSRCQSFPLAGQFGKALGKRVFSRVLGTIIPYAGSIGAQVEHLEPGHAVILLPDKRRVRNHLNSVHAIALANLAELSTGLAMISGLQPGVRAILVGLNVSYEKKARGTLRAECHCVVPKSIDRQEVAVETQIMNEDGDVVTRATATWLIGSK